MKLHSASGKWRLGLSLALVAIFFWGTLSIALTIVLQKLDVYTVTWFRFLVSFIILGIYLGIRKQLPKIQKLRPSSFILLAIATIFLASNYLLFIQGLSQTSPANAQLLFQIAHVCIGLGGLIIFKERYTRSQWMGLGILICGFILFFHEQLVSLIATSGQYIYGCILVILSALAFAVYALAQKQLLEQLPSSNIMLIIYGGAALLFSPTTHPQTIGSLSPLQGGILIFCALNTLFAYGAFSEALAHWEASKISALVATTPIITLTVGKMTTALIPSLLAPEHYSIIALFGGLMVISGSVTIALGQTR